MNKHTIVALVQDRPGVLNRTVSLFRRRGYNIESLAVGHTETEGVSRMTLVVESDHVEQVVKQLMDAGLVHDPADLYRLTAEDLLKLEGFAEKRVENALRSIQASKQRPLGRVLFALGIRHVGAETAELLARHFGSLEALMQASPAAVTRERLEHALWGEEPPDGDMLRSHIYELRRSVDGPFPVKLIHTLPRTGYRIGL